MKSRLWSVLPGAVLLLAVSACSPANSGSEGTTTSTASVPRPSTSTVATASTPASPSQVRPRTAFTLEFEPTAAGNKVEVAGRTNLPDGSRISVVLDRAINDPSRADEGPGYFTVDSIDVIARGGTFTATVVDNRKHSAKKWVDSYNIGESPELKQSLTDTVEVMVEFSPHNEQQPEAALAAVGGSDGKWLESSKQATKSRASNGRPYWILRTAQELQLPPA